MSNKSNYVVKHSSSGRKAMLIVYVDNHDEEILELKKPKNLRSKIWQSQVFLGHGGSTVNSFTKEVRARSFKGI